MDQTIPQGSWWSRNWKWFIPAGCLSLLATCGCCIGGAFFVGSRAIQSSRAYQDALARAKADPDVQAALGTPVEAGQTFQFSINAQNDVTRTEARVPLKGPKGEGSLHIKARESNGEVSYQQLDVVVGSQVIHLVERPGAPAGPAGPGEGEEDGDADLDEPPDDLPGAPRALKELPVPSEDSTQCTKACLDEPKCKAYLFVKASGGGPARCHLLDGPMDEAPPGTIYGVIKQ